MDNENSAHSFTEGAEVLNKNKQLVDVIKTLVYRSLQWEDGEIKGWDEQMIESLTPILISPFLAKNGEITALHQQRETSQKERDNLKKRVAELEEKADFKNMVDRVHIENIKTIAQQKAIIDKLVKTLQITHDCLSERIYTELKEEIAIVIAKVKDQKL